MIQYIVDTKDRSYMVEADAFYDIDVTDGRRTIYKFIANGEVVAIFDSRNVKAVTKR